VSEAQLRDLRCKTHQTIEACSRHMENFAFNTYIAALMSFRNVLQEMAQTPAVRSSAWAEAIETMLLLVAPVTPHVAEELWPRRGRPYSIHRQSWPQFAPELAKEDLIELAVQINGKTRAKIKAPPDIDAETVKAQALAAEGVEKYIDGKPPKKVIYVPGRLINIVIS
jgi:leucyl-tRNA synthetase